MFYPEVPVYLGVGGGEWWWWGTMARQTLEEEGRGGRKRKGEDPCSESE